MTPALNRLVRRWLPILAWLPGYSRADFGGDATAGVVTAILLVPQGMAYALLAGLPPQVGLYASILPLVLYGLFGSSRTLAVGPVAIVSLMTATSLADVTARTGVGHAEAALTLALMCAGIYVVMGLLRVGFLVNFLSHHVIAGFTSAAALIIGFSQLQHLLGIELQRSHRIDHILAEAANQIATINPMTVTIGIGAIAALLLLRARVPALLTTLGLPDALASGIGKAGPLLVVTAGTVAVALADLNTGAAVSIVGAIPAGLPVFALPPLAPALLQALLPAALLITFVGYLESVSVAKALASKRRQKIDADQELVGLGAANLAASLSGGYPVAGGFGRSMVNFSAGARTPMASILTAAMVLLAVLFLTPLLHDLPKAVLAAIIVSAVANLIDVASLRQAWAYNKADAAAMLATFASVLALGVEQGILVGIAVALALHLWRTSRPHIAVVGRVGASEHFRNVLRHEVATEPSVALVRVDESLFFTNAKYLEDFVLGHIADHQDVRHLVLICSAVNQIDSSALETLETLIDELCDAGVTLHLAEVKGPVMDRLQRSDFLAHLEPGQVFLSTHEAAATLAPATEGHIALEPPADLAAPQRA